MLVHARRSALTLMLVTVGCAAQSGAPEPEKLGKSEDHLFGAAEINDCTSGVQSFIQKSINIGKFIAQTDEFKSCVKTNYEACDDDDDKNVSDLVAITESANPLKLACTDLGFSTSTGGTMGQTSWWCQHGYGYDGNETFDIDKTYAKAMLDLWNAGDFFGGFNMAGTIWHEAMHVHGYQHGDSGNSDPNQAAIDNANSCGYTPAQFWFWRTNSAPYDVGFCMVGAYTRNGAIGRHGSGLLVDDGDPGAAARSSIVDLYYKQAHKLLTDVKRTDTFTRIAAGTLTKPANLKLEAAGNSLPQQATPLAFNGATAQDTLFDAQDQEYWTITIPAKDRLHVDVSFAWGAPKPTLEVKRFSGGTLYNVLGPAATTTSTSSGVSLEQDLYPGTYLVHVKAAAGTNVVPITLKATSAPAPKAPSSCTAFVNCLGHVHVSCANEPETLVLQEWKYGSGWSDVVTDDDRNRASVDLVDSATTGGTAWYRVCAESYGKTSCSATITLNTDHAQCSDVYDCAHAAIFACFPVPGDESFCCNTLPHIDPKPIGGIVLPGPIHEGGGIAAP